MRDIAREVDERAGRGRRHLAAGPEGQLALGDVKPLVLVVVNVQRRPVALRGVVLDDGNSAVRGLGRRLDREERTQEPAGIALARLHRDGSGGRLRWVGNRHGCQPADAATVCPASARNECGRLRGVAQALGGPSTTSRPRTHLLRRAAMERIGRPRDGDDGRRRPTTASRQERLSALMASGVPARRAPVLSAKRLSEIRIPGGTVTIGVGSNRQPSKREGKHDFHHDVQDQAVPQQRRDAGSC